MGRLVRDLELRSLPSGTPVCAFSLATNSAFVNKEGKRAEESEFHNVVVFRRHCQVNGQSGRTGESV
jgi:single-strand DNA-binding protein